MASNNESRLREILDGIKPVDKSLEGEVNRRLDNLTKPVGSLGTLEEIVRRYCLIRGNVMPDLPRKIVLLFAGDHGVVEEGVSKYPQVVTQQMILNFLRGGAAINVLTRHVNSDIWVIDIGSLGDFEETEGLIIRKVGKGTKNFLKEPAMSREEAIESILVGFDVASRAFERGYDLIGTGDMGIGNTTSSSAITCVILRELNTNVTDKGTGIDSYTYTKKLMIIGEACQKYKEYMRDDPIMILSAVGGYEIGGICGAILAAGYHKKAVVIDGFISTAAALLAYKLNAHVLDYVFPSHLSDEKGHLKQLDFLGIKPIITLNMRLGEGTGAALAFNIIEAAIKLYKEMATFDEANVDKA